MLATRGALRLTGAQEETSAPGLVPHLPQKRMLSTSRKALAFRATFFDEQQTKAPRYVQTDEVEKFGSFLSGRVREDIFDHVDQQICVGLTTAVPLVEQLGGNSTTKRAGFQCIETEIDSTAYLYYWGKGTHEFPMHRGYSLLVGQ